MLSRKAVLKNFGKFTGKHHGCFPVNSPKIFRTAFLHNTYGGDYFRICQDIELEKQFYSGIKISSSLQKINVFLGSVP